MKYFLTFCSFTLKCVEVKRWHNLYENRKNDGFTLKKSRCLI